MTARFNETGARGLLLNNLPIDHTLDILLETKEQKEKTKVINKTVSYSIQAIICNNFYLDEESLTGLPICEDIDYFKRKDDQDFEYYEYQANEEENEIVNEGNSNHYEKIETKEEEKFVHNSENLQNLENSDKMLIETDLTLIPTQLSTQQNKSNFKAPIENNLSNKENKSGNKQTQLRTKPKLKKVKVNSSDFKIEQSFIEMTTGQEYRKISFDEETKKDLPIPLYNINLDEDVRSILSHEINDFQEIQEQDEDFLEEEKQEVGYEEINDEMKNELTRKLRRKAARNVNSEDFKSDFVLPENLNDLVIGDGSKKLNTNFLKLKKGMKESKIESNQALNGLVTTVTKKKKKVAGLFDFDEESEVKKSEIFEKNKKEKSKPIKKDKDDINKDLAVKKKKSKIQERFFIDPKS